MKKPRLTVKAKLIAAFSAILIIPMLTLGWLSYTSAKEQLENALVKTASENVRLVDELLDQSLTAQAKDIEYIASRTGRADLQEQHARQPASNCSPITRCIRKSGKCTSATKPGA